MNTNNRPEAREQVVFPQAIRNQNFVLPAHNAMNYTEVGNKNNDFLSSRNQPKHTLLTRPII